MFWRFLSLFTGQLLIVFLLIVQGLLVDGNPGKAAFFGRSMG
jgi:hypothetical protein